MAALSIGADDHGLWISGDCGDAAVLDIERFMSALQRAIAFPIPSGKIPICFPILGNRPSSQRQWRNSAITEIDTLL
jgi:hypothetical protein